MASGNVDRKWGGGKIEEDGGLRTMELLRGRLLAERAASKSANEDVQHLGIKLLELENQLRAEEKSRNRAEKRLKSLMKKLESLNISTSTISIDSEQPKSDISSSSPSSSSTASSCVTTMNLPQGNDPQKTLTTNPPECGIEEKIKHPNFTHVLEDGASDDAAARSNQNPSAPDCEESPKSAAKADFEPQAINPNTDEQSSCCSLKSSMEEETHEEPTSSDGATDHDDSLALVAIDFPKTSQPTNPIIVVDASVQDVLDALRHAREKLQWSMKTRHGMTRVGSK